jgi:hypothetical protein
MEDQTDKGRESSPPDTTEQKGVNSPLLICSVSNSDWYYSEAFSSMVEKFRFLRKVGRTAQAMNMPAKTSAAARASAGIDFLS